MYIPFSVILRKTSDASTIKVAIHMCTFHKTEKTQKCISGVKTSMLLLNWGVLLLGCVLGTVW